MASARPPVPALGSFGSGGAPVALLGGVGDDPGGFPPAGGVDVGDLGREPATGGADSRGDDPAGGVADARSAALSENPRAGRAPATAMMAGAIYASLAPECTTVRRVTVRCRGTPSSKPRLRHPTVPRRPPG